MADKTQQWHAYAAEVFQARNQLLTIIANPEYQQLVTKKELQHLVKALHHIDMFRSRAEDRMFRQGLQETQIWYPGKGKS